MYTISCRDVGRDCDCVIQGETEGDHEECGRTCSQRPWLQGRRCNDSRDERENKITYTQILVLVL